MHFIGPHPAGFFFFTFGLLANFLNVLKSEYTFYHHMNCSFPESCYKEDQIFQPKHTEDQATSELDHHEASSIPQPTISLGLITSRPSATYKVHSPKRRKFSSISNTSTPSYFSEKRQSLFAKFYKNHSSLSRQQSRVNFEFQEDINYNDKDFSSDTFGTAKSGRRFSSRKLSIVSCYKSSILFDPQSSNQDLLNLKEIELFSKIPSNPEIPKQKSFSDHEYIPKHVVSFEAKVPTAIRRNSIDRTFFQQSMASFFALPTVVSSSNQASKFAADRQESGLLNRNAKDYLHSGFQSHTTSYSPAVMQQSSENIILPSFQNVGFSLSYENASSFIRDQNNIDTDFIEEENSADSAEDEDNHSSTRYMTANTDTEEQNFPVAKAFNTHVEELKLDVLLQKADRLRLNESGKMESFELLCDHKEKMIEKASQIVFFNLSYYYIILIFCRYAVLCGCVSEFEGLQNKINYGHHFKEHLDMAIELLPAEPFLYYLKGRYCYTISKLSWIEKKMAATLFGKIPSSTIQESFHNFLKAEELQSGYSMSNYMYLAKCCFDLEKNQDAWKFCNMALLLPIVSKEDKEAHKEVKKIIAALKRTHDFGKPRLSLQQYS
ncbi:PREDICTED: regulator of microtubule dynamics protein 2 [Dipodomys ordii]|uniref:Regulator of microtubule dynamics protein 2 n=1 Tax=Dipodomys ordii TaxID=10020 RepID=A0A1S3F9Y3_DIPOR|nr:PREDICTED: regulator of microtubule dynamics protein 2 [Dipodomys ordii]